MIKYTTYIKDVIGNNYLGIKYDNTSISPFLKELEEHLGDDYEEYTNYQSNRDGGGYHMTVINVMEYNKLSNEMGFDKFVKSLDKVFNYEIDDIKLMGLGTATRGTNTTYFVVCESEKLNAIRKRYDLSPRDLYITIGFKYKDVFGVRKNIIMDKNTMFIKLLSQKFYKNDNWNFIRSISNFNLDIKSEIIPVSLNDRYLKVKCDGYYMDIGLLNKEIKITTQYIIEDELPRLSETEISKILNK